MGRASAQTWALQQPGSTGLLVAILGLIMKGAKVHAVVAEQGQESDRLPTCTIQETKPEPTPFTSACASKYVEFWKKEIEAEFIGPVPAGMFTQESEVYPLGCV